MYPDLGIHLQMPRPLLVEGRHSRSDLLRVHEGEDLKGVVAQVGHFQPQIHVPDVARWAETCQKWDKTGTVFQGLAKPIRSEGPALYALQAAIPVMANSKMTINVLYFINLKNIPILTNFALPNFVCDLVQASVLTE